MVEKALVTQPTAAPSRKMFIGACAGLATGVVLLVADDVAANVEFLGKYMDLLKVFAPVGVGYLISYITRDSAPAGAK